MVLLLLAALNCTAWAEDTIIANPMIANPTTAGNVNSSLEVSAEELSWSARAGEVLLNALSLTGIRYKYGGNSPETGFDCSGFVRYVFNQAANLTLPRSALEMSRLGVQVSKNELQPGDLVFFNTMKSAFSHVGIYVGDNRFIHSPSSGGAVRVENMQSTYWAKHFNGAKRIEENKQQ